MPKKNDAALKRLKSITAGIQEKWAAVAQLKPLINSASESWSKDQPFSDRLQAHFKRVGLDPDQPAHRALMLEYQAELLDEVLAYAGPAEKGHRKKEWTDSKLRQLLEHYKEEHKRDPHRSPKDIRRDLRTRHRSHSLYAGVKNDRVHQDRLSEARRQQKRRLALEEFTRLLALLPLRD